MSITKYAAFDTEILDIKGARTRQHTASLDKLADFENYRTDDGYLYVRIRAISSRVNKNHDGWPSIELAGNSDIFERHHGAGGFTIEAADGPAEQGFSTFVGKPIFVDHNNSNPKRARGVIVDAKLNVLDHKTAAQSDDYWGGHDVDPEHMPPTEVELLLEVDAKTFPRLAKAIVSGDLDGFSMGCDVEHSKCSHCGHIASAPDEYCSHIMMKGAHHDFKTADGHKVSKKSYENCYGIHFFEISAVFDPADETALAREVRSAVHKEGELYGNPGGPMTPDPVRGGQDSMVADLAMVYEMKGVDPDTALDMAQRAINSQNPLPGAGDGDVYSPKRWDYDTSPMGGAVVQQASPPRDREKGIFPNNPITGTTKMAENPLPQDMMTRAPEEVDTLREEQLCPICGNDMEAETCQVCGYVSPPKEFDNPDLDKAQEIREQMKQNEENVTDPQTAQEPGAAPGGAPAPAGGAGGPAPMAGGPTKAPIAAKVTNDMRSWTPKVHPKQAAKLSELARTENTTAQATPEPAVTPAMATARQLMANAQRNHSGANMHTRTADGPTPPGDTSPKTRTDVVGVGGVDEASNEAASKADAQIDVVGVGGTGVSDVSADSSESLPTAGKDSLDSGFNTDKTTEDSGPTKTFGDSDGGHSGVTDPVTSEPFPASEDGVKASRWRVAYEDGTLEQQEQQGDPVAQGGSAVKGVQPVAEQFGERVNVLEHTTSPSNNSGPTKTWSGTDGNGVLKQQDPVTREDQEWGGVKVPDVKLHTNARAHFMAAMKCAEMEVELGLVSPQDKLNRFAELETQHPAQVKAQIDTLSRVKTAGLAKLAAHRQSGVRKLPTQFGRTTSAPHGFERIAADTAKPAETPLSDEMLDAALFTR